MTFDNEFDQIGAWILFFSRLIITKITFGNCNVAKLTLFFVIAPTIIGHTIPDNVPTPFEIPIKILAYLGAISK